MKEIYSCYVCFKAENVSDLKLPSRTYIYKSSWRNVLTIKRTHKPVCSCCVPPPHMCERATWWTLDCSAEADWARATWLTVCVPEDVQRLDRVLVQLEVVPQDLDQHVFTVLQHPVTRNLKRHESQSDRQKHPSSPPESLHLISTTATSLTNEQYIYLVLKCYLTSSAQYFLDFSDTR